MGEARRKKMGPCICGLGLPAMQCCWTPRGFHKAPQRIDLHNSGLTGSRDGCYMRKTNACSDTLSGEHLISESVLGVLAEKEITVTGLPWLKGESKTFRFRALTARCLCTRHNSLLSPIDTAGAKFFDAVQSSGTNASAPRLYLLSGHDVERWLLRSLAAFGVSRNLAIDGAAVDQEFVDRLDIVHLLEAPTAWNKPLGLYVLGGHGDQFTQRHDVKLTPLFRKGAGELLGITLDIQGLPLALLAADHDINGTGLDRGFYRPRAIVFDRGASKHRIQLSWEDDQRHVDVIFNVLSAPPASR